ncbi:MAG: zinc-dependent metalloprotease [Oligoflexales bacterium]
MKYILALLVILGFSEICLADADFSPVYVAKRSDMLSRNALYQSKAPGWARWDRREFVFKISKQALGEVYQFGILCSAGDNCQLGQAQTPSRKVQLAVRGNNLLVLPAGFSSEGNPSLRPLARWEIAQEDSEAIYVLPHGNDFQIMFDTGIQQQVAESHVLDRFFHDFRDEEGKGIWFHETINYAYRQSTEVGSTYKEATDTFAIYLIKDPSHPGFVPKSAIKEVGYFVNGETIEDQMLYDPRSEEFNPKDLKANRWGRNASIEWIVNRSVPTERFEQVKTGILAWQQHLPQDLRLSVRLAEEGEELDSPLKNVLIYTVSQNPDDLSGVADDAYNLETGEIFKATIHITGPAAGSHTARKDGENITPPKSKVVYKYGSLLTGTSCDFHNNRFEGGVDGETVEHVVSHEVGHTLGLRHNFKGSLYANPEFPGGSSIMEYGDLAKQEIGPYDLEAIQWGYFDVEPSRQLPFCSDESAGFFMFLPALDPECQRFDRVAEDHFDYHFPRAEVALKRTLGEDVGSDQDASFIDLIMIMPYLRADDAPFYNAEHSFRVLKFFDLVASTDVASLPEGKRTELWGVVEFLTNSVFTQRFLGIHNERYLVENFAVSSRFMDWVARNSGGKDGYAVRESIVKGLATWKDNPYGASLAAHMKEKLVYWMNEVPDATLKLENAYLAQIL